MRRVVRVIACVVLVGALASACGGESTTEARGVDRAADPRRERAKDRRPERRPAPERPRGSTPRAEPVAPPRTITEQPWAPFATVGEVTLVHPSSIIERIGFHQSGHDGARELVPAETAVRPSVLESRERGTAPRTAADIVVEPATEIRSPVTGTVVRSGGYILYCEHNDDYAVIEPDAHPGWEVKLLHIDGVQVVAGQRVEAGVTVIAPHARQLPFDSQVDELRSADPAWPHVHVEVVDPAIPDLSSSGGC